MGKKFPAQSNAGVEEGDRRVAELFKLSREAVARGDDAEGERLAREIIRASQIGVEREDRPIEMRPRGRKRRRQMPARERRAEGLTGDDELERDAHARVRRALERCLGTMQAQWSYYEEFLGELKRMRRLVEKRLARVPQPPNLNNAQAQRIREQVAAAVQTLDTTLVEWAKDASRALESELDDRAPALAVSLEKYSLYKSAEDAWIDIARHELDDDELAQVLSACGAALFDYKRDREGAIRAIRVRRHELDRRLAELGIRRESLDPSQPGSNLDADLIAALAMLDESGNEAEIGFAFLSWRFVLCVRGDAWTIERSDSTDAMTAPECLAALGHEYRRRSQ